MLRTSLFALVVFFASTVGGQPSGSLAPAQRMFTTATLRGDITFLTPPAIELNGKSALLSPGTRIRSHNNLIILSGSLTGQRHKVHYTLNEITSQVQDVWLLRPEEIAVTPWPESTSQAQSWQFDSISQRWSKP